MGNVTAKLKGRWRKPVTQQRLEMSRNGKQKHPKSQRSKVSKLGYKGYIKNGKIHIKGATINDPSYSKNVEAYARNKGFSWLETRCTSVFRKKFAVGEKAIYHGLLDAQRQIMSEIYEFAKLNFPVFTGNMLTSIYSAVYKHGNVATVSGPEHFIGYKKPRSKKLTKGNKVDKNGYQWAYFFYDQRRKYPISDDNIVNTSGNYAYEDARAMIDKAVNDVPWSGLTRIPNKRKQYAFKIAFGAEEYANRFMEYRDIKQKFNDTNVRKIINNNILYYLRSYEGTSSEGK